MRYILTVSEVNKYIKEMISSDLVLSNLSIKGEISNFKYHYSGHMYFTLKDEKSLLKCVMFKNRAQSLRFVPEDGMKVIAGGYISVFERDGQYQLYVDEMHPDGVGDLYKAFEQLKKKLMEEGLFDSSHKKKLPYLPRAVGVVTSITGAVIKDIINVLSRRFYHVDLKIFPVAVQGETAPEQIARAVRKFNELKCVDVIIVARGGGSLEELWAFNEEVVARSIYDSEIPVISAVGHETDFTIADFVADVRAPTPSAAAEIVMPEKRKLYWEISSLEARLKNAVEAVIASLKHSLARLADSTPFRQPYNMVYQRRLELDFLARSMSKELSLLLEKKKTCLGMLSSKLEALSPFTVLSRGYSIASLERDGRVVKSINEVISGDVLEIMVTDGVIDCTVKGVRKKEAEKLKAESDPSAD